MIYLISGSPGVGKTSMVVDMILNNYEGLFKYEADDGTQIDRPLYFCHIDGLDEKKFKAHRLSEEELQSAPLCDIVPTGSVVIVDECDYTYPTRSASKDVPPYVRTLKELRHEGFTLILMTQHPTMIDKYVRNLVGKHIHLERAHLGTKRYEWYRCEESLNSTAFQSAVQSYYKPPKKAFKYYKSASKHIKFVKKRPKVFFIAPILIIGFVWGSLNFIGKLTEKTKVAPQQTVQTQALTASEAVNTAQVAQTNIVPTAASQAAASIPSIQPRDASAPIGTLASDYIPVIPSRPETKPIYDNLRNPVNMELVVGCVASDNSCNCYTEQGTKTDVADAVCRDYVENGIFQIYRNVNDTGSNVGSRAAPTAAIN